MNRLELNLSVEKAADFLTDFSHIAYYSVLNCLGQLVDKFIKDNTGYKEVLDLNNTLIKLNHMDDVKATYTNGFHVNTAFTRTD